MEDNKVGDNGKPKEEPQFDCFIKIFFNTKTKVYSFETNVPDVVTGYGLCDLGKKGVDTHISKAQNKIIPTQGGLRDFARRIFK